jgi:hypothetical protein
MDSCIHSLICGCEVNLWFKDTSVVVGRVAVAYLCLLLRSYGDLGAFSVTISLVAFRNLSLWTSPLVQICLISTRFLDVPGAPCAANIDSTRVQ